MKKLEQVGMASSSVECNGTSHRVNFVNEYPVSLNMTVKHPFPFSMKRVVVTFRRQRFFVNDDAHDFPKTVYIHVAFIHQF